ncbi:hypothetical protein GCM10010434_076810 [Winogradskya humida]
MTGEITQDTVREPVAWNRAQLFLHGLHRSGRCETRDVDRYGEQRREPPERTRQVEVHGVLFASVTLQLQQERLVRGNSKRERGDQRVIDTAMDRRGDSAEQPFGDVIRQNDRQALLGGHGVGVMVERAITQDARRGLRCRRPERQVSGEVGVAQSAGPLPERGRRGLDRQPTPQVLSKHPQRNPIHHHVMHSNNQLTRRPRQTGRARRARRRQVRECDQPIGAQPGDRRLKVLAHPQHIVSRHRTHRRDGQHSAINGTSQHVMRSEQPVDQRGHIPRNRQRYGLEEPVVRITDLIQPGNDRGSRDLADRRDDSGFRRLRGRDNQGQARWSRVGEEVTRPQCEAGPPGCAYSTDRDNAVTAEREEVILSADLVQPEHRCEDLTERNLSRGTR